ncbi:glutamine--fructose-6-phosphate transaminase [Trichodesmium erythraeum IMS101]|uniref:Glutamine--fructose-6-phosphate aminotransferase [isomerizing] n=1 Tax=Trichodesmium erythraeum (strain IMS101) TaxID=203124 RepID=Q119B0_TRIEI|nr:glutamine--fructose-6-phosphate transaminase (isomerizing) [Trichodesmium erythraeum GBRTRLIN201]MCH2049004.1 glutamine--fructose-6-phosphate transaminase (isomerizing) [Trichodesmium sp. ALOHA_ZT_67]MDE5102548.1 glutamine--fructose-6-phosphate transaminase (isomerizing) [Trichodesmium sp. St19_bin2]
MCGIVGYVGTQLATEILLSGLEKLEYRGYDSAGVATICNGQVKSVRAKGKLYNLREKLAGVEMLANVGIGHTRWATHGKPEEYNAHPHTDDTERVAVVENGIVENYRELRKELESQGHKFVSETDTEVIPHLIAEFLSNFAGNEKGRTKNRENFLEAVRQTVNKLDGAFAIAVVCADYPNEIIVARQQAPISIGLGQGEFFCASDTPALISHTQVVVSLDNGEMARLTPLGVEVYNFDGDRINKLPRILNWSPNLVDKNIFKHFMLKEIHEQPNVIRNCLETYINSDWDVKNIQISPTNLNLSSSLYKNLEQVEIFACGTSWHASLIGKYLLEQLAGISTTVNYASEARYAPSPLRANTLTIGVTQSGETADTLAALAIEQQRRLDKPVEFTSRLLGITNRVESSIASLVHQIIDIRAGVEIGVAATKTFVAQVIAFYFLAIDLGWQRKYLSGEKIAEIINGLQKIPAQMEQILDSQNSQIEDFAHQFNNTQDLIFIGRGINYPIALEGALKLKEISYIHAEGYPAGEMKHGPIALLDDQVPVVAIAMPGLVYEKVLSNAQEAKARDAQLIGVTPESTEVDMFDNVLAVPAVDELLSPMLTVIPLQLLAYHIAAHRGLDVDQPRNLAKSVTVE